MYPKPVFRKAAAKDLPAILASYKELWAYESAHGLNTNWPAGIYPNPAMPLAKIETGAMYLLEKDGALCASMALDSVQSPEYDEIAWRWTGQPERVLVIHLLVISPNQFRHGYGSAMLDYAKEFGRQNGYATIRIDTWLHNEPAKSLYRKNGFEIAGYGPISLPGLTQDEVYLEYRL